MFSTFTPAEAHVLQVLLGDKAGQPLIPEYDRLVQRFMEFFGEASHLFALQACVAAHMQRLADDNLVNLVFLRQTADRLNVGFQGLSTNRRPRLGRQHKSVTDSNTYCLVAHIESHNPHNFMIPPGLHRAIIESTF